MTVSITFRRERKIAGWLLSTPLLIMLAMLLIWPVYLGIKTSFTHDVLSEFATYGAGLENYQNLIKQPNFWLSLRFTMIYAIIATIAEVILGFALALLFDRVFPGKRVLFSLMLVPIMIAPSLMAVMYRLILNENIGVIPGVLQRLGIEFSIFEQHNVFGSLIALDVLEFTAFTFLLSYSALQNMPSEIYEAAAIDGANARQVLTRVVLPMLRPALAIIFLLRILDSIRTFDSVFILTGGGPGTTTQTVGIYIYKTAFIFGDFGLAASASVVLVLLLAPFMPSIIKQFNLNQGGGK
jgi:multiple sugar transport system permease protein